MRTRVFVAMSGGVDSSVAAALLCEKGFSATGITMDIPGLPSPAIKAKEICEFLKIPHILIDCREILEKKIIHYFIEEYQKGRTPNPCIYCNDIVKFGFFFDQAFTFGAHYFATGHYAQIKFHPPTSRYFLLKGTDPSRDQSYFLAHLDQRRLSKTLFPLGAYSKDSVREIAKSRKIPVAEGADSQEICFLEGRDYRDFCGIRDSSFSGKPGLIKDLSGEVIARHKGIHLYTLGQRKGTSAGGGTPWYVARIDPTTNTVYVGRREELFVKELYVDSCRTISGEPLPLRYFCRVKIRYGSPDVPCILESVDNARWRVLFLRPQWAPAPGQIAVFYLGNRVVAAGTILAMQE
ncbi:MAG: tRNA 2-thiouridine(34) synthase MnmA [Candidatus Ratteibacteria bacterium]